MKDAILKTLIYFDIFDYPLSSDEVFLYLFSFNDFCNNILDKKKEIKKYKNKEIEKKLQELILENKIDNKNGFYFLKNRDKIVEIRKQRKEISLKKIKKAKKAVWFLRKVLFVRAIILTSNLSYNNASEKSDIDFLIITKNKRIWTTRFLTTIWFKIFNLRPENGKNKDKFCLSFYLDENFLNLECTKIEDNDLILKYFLKTYKCLFNENNVWKKFVENNNWAEINFVDVKNNKTKILKLFFEKMFSNKCEDFFRKIQLSYMPDNLKDEAKRENNKVIINNRILKFHLNDNRKKIKKEYEKRIMIYK